MDQERLTEAIGSLYEAALCPEDWPRALKALTAAVDARMSQFLVWDSAAGCQAASVTWNVDPADEQRYARHYGALDPHRPMIAGWPCGRLLLSHEILDRQTVDRSEFYQDFLIPSGGGHLAGIRLTDDADRLMVLGIHRDLRRGPFLAPDQTIFMQLMPHLVRAMSLHQRLKPLHQQAGLAARLLDALPQGALAVDDRAGILLLNRSAQAILARAGGLRVRQGRLTSDRPAALAELLAALARATCPSRQARSASAFRLRETEPALDLLVLVCPLPERLSCRFHAEPAALVLLEQAARQRRFAPELLRQLFGLTRAEAALAVALLHGRSPEEIATERGVAMPTVRSQLQSLFAKTDCRRQADLIRLLGPIGMFRLQDDDTLGERGPNGSQR